MNLPTALALRSRRALFTVAPIAFMLFFIVIPAGRATALAGVISYTDPELFSSAILVEGITTFDELPSPQSIPNGAAIASAVYSFNVQGGFSGLVTNAFLGVSSPNTLGVDRSASDPLRNFFFPGDAVLLTFSQPIRALSAYFSSNPAAGAAHGFLFVATPVGTALSGDALPAGSFGFPANALRFVGITSDVPFTQATLGITNPSPGNVGFVLDNIIVGHPSTSQPSIGSEVVARVDVSTDGRQGNGDTFRPFISANGRFVAFDTGSVFAGDDTNGWGDVYVRDVKTQTTSRVSIASDGTQALSGHSCYPSLSADGRFVAFQSNASNLVPDDSNEAGDVFVHDRFTGSTTRVSVATGGIQGNQPPDLCFSMFPIISADGRFVAFASDATNLVPNDTNAVRDVFVHDRFTGTTERASVGTGGTQSNGRSGFFNGISISGDGRFVVFESDATNLVSDDTNGVRDVYVRDRVLGTTERVSVDSEGVQGDRQSVDGVAITPDGRYVAFTSDASNLVPGGTNGTRHVFLRDRATRTTTLISTSSGGNQGNDLSLAPGLSADGRFMFFQSFATNLVPGDTNGVDDVFIHDRLTRTTTRVVASDGSEANCGVLPDERRVNRVSYSSADGRMLAFESCASNFVIGDTNRVSDAFLARVAIGPNWIVAATSGGGSRVRGFDALGRPTPLDLLPSQLGFPEGVHLAFSDVDGDGAADLIVGAANASGQAPRVRVFSGSTANRVLADFDANAGLPGGVNVAACDLTGQGRAHIITAPGPGGGTQVRMWRFDPAPNTLTQGTVTQLGSFPAYDTAPGGIVVACGDVDGTGHSSIITGRGSGSPPLVRVFTVDATNVISLRTEFLAYPESFTGGLSVAAGDVRRRGRAAIVTGSGPGLPPVVRVWTLAAGAATPGEEVSFLPYAEDSPGGVNVGAGDTTGKGGAQVVTGPGVGTDPIVKTFDVGASAPRELTTSVFIPGGASAPRELNAQIAVPPGVPIEPTAPPTTAPSPEPPPESTTYVLNVTKGGNGGGTVQSAPGGILCAPTCAQSFDDGRQVRLSAQRAPGAAFASWTGCDTVVGTACTVAMGGTRYVGVTFTLFQVTVSLSLNQTSFQPGDPFSVDVTVSNPGAAVPVDVLFGVLLPAATGPGVECSGHSRVLFLVGSGFVARCPPISDYPRWVQRATIAANLPATTVPGLFRAVVPPGATPGAYTLFLVFTSPGGSDLDLLGYATVDFVIGAESGVAGLSAPNRLSPPLWLGRASEKGH